MDGAEELVKAINEVERIVRGSPPEEALKRLLTEPVPYKELAIIHLLVIYANRLGDRELAHLSWGGCSGV